MSLTQFFYFFVLMNSNIKSSIGDETINKNPYAVTPNFDGLEELYLRLRNPNPSPNSKLTAKMKWQICKNIFVKGEHISPVNLRYEILLNPARDENWLRNEEEDIFLDIFEKRLQISLGMCMPGTPIRDYCLVNRSRLREIAVRQQIHRENVFECQTVDREHYIEVDHSVFNDTEPYFRPNKTPRTRDDKEHIRRYFVSDSVYDVNEVSGAEPVAGRFVFYYDGRQKLIVLHALAEESPPLFRTNKKEHYLKRRNGYSPASNEQDDPVCGLDKGRKLHVCNGVLFEEKRRYGMEVKLVGERCEQVSFSLKGEPEEMQYSEWMMKCGFAGSNAVTSYVSRGYIDSEVFVHITSGVDGRLTLYGYKSKIAVLSDRPTPAERQSHRMVEPDERSRLLAQSNTNNNQND